MAMSRIILISLLFYLSLVVAFAAEDALTDPTRPEFYQKPAPVKKSPKVRKSVRRQAPKKLILQQTMISSAKRFAVINGFKLTEGERIKGGYRVLKINDESVVLTRQNHELVLHLAGGTNIKERSR